MPQEAGNIYTHTVKTVRPVYEKYDITHFGNVILQELRIGSVISLFELIRSSGRYLYEADSFESVLENQEGFEELIPGFWINDNHTICVIRIGVAFLLGVDRFASQRFITSLSEKVSSDDYDVNTIKTLNRELKVKSAYYILNQDHIELKINIFPTSDNHISKWMYKMPEAFSLYRREIADKLPKDIIPKNYMSVFYLTNPDTIHTVILGQDPYPNQMATGIAFENVNGVKSPSLRNINKKLEEANKPPLTIDYVLNGTLLLNTALTTLEGNPGAHTSIWEPFTELIIQGLAKYKHLTWLLWGSHAIFYKKYIPEHHTVHCSSHPSPLSANRKLKDYPAFMDQDFSKIFNQ